MRVEVHSAADFVMNLLRTKHGKDLTDIQLEKFKSSLSDIMLIRYQQHWYPEVPTKGSGYRCIRINGKMDPMIEQAGVAVGLQPRILRKMLPAELTMWIDPDEVAYRIGENGSICVLLDAVQSRSSPSSDVESTGSEESVGGRLDISVLNYLVDGSSKSSNSSSPYVNYYHNNNHNQYHHNNHHNNHRYHNNRHSNYHYNNNNHQQQQQNLPDNSMYHWDGLNSSTSSNFNSFNSKVRTNC